MADLDELIADLFGEDDHLAESAALVLPSHGPAALDRLRQTLHDPDPERRWWTARALAGFELPEISQLLISALSDTDPDVAACVLLAMRNRPDLSFVPHLLPLLCSPITPLARLAADALIAIGPAASSDLIKLIESSDGIPCTETVRAIAHLGEYSAVPSLFRLLDCSNPLVEYWAEQGLERLGIGMSFFTPGQ